MALAGFGCACVWKGRALAGEGDHLLTRSGLSLAGSAPRPCGHEDLGRNLRPQVGATGWGVICGSAGQYSQVVAGRAQQSSVHALPHAYRRSSGTVRVPTNNQVKFRAVQSQAGEGLAGR